MSEYMPKFYTLEDMTQEDLNKLALERNTFASEIERLNKFEKWIEEQIKISQTHNNQLGVNFCNICKNKLNELKGSDK